MIQVTGNLKVREPESGELGHTPSPPTTTLRTTISTPPPSPPERKEVVGFVGECRLIESTSSILEISIPQSYFTTTISMDMKIVSVESQ